MRKAVILLLLSMPLAAYAQKAPDNDDIFAKTMDADSPFNYAALMLRYDSGDLTLTEEDYHYLYYGYAFTDPYKPLKSIPAEDNIIMVFDKDEEPDFAGMMEIIRSGMEVMKDDPFSPRNLNFLTYAYGAIGDTINERINYDRMTKVLTVIEASGTGLTEKSPMHVLKFSHAADLLTARGLTITNRRVVSKDVEYITLLEKDGRNKGYYFDFSRVFWASPEDTPKKERRWKINNWPPDRP